MCFTKFSSILYWSDKMLMNVRFLVTLSGQGLNRGDVKELVKAVRPGLYTSVIFPESLGPKVISIDISPYNRFHWAKGYY